MADFNVPIEGAASSNVTPSQPVQDNSTATALSGISDIFSVAGKSYATKAKADATAQENSVVADFSQRFLTLTDAADRGIIKRSDANLKGRAMLVQYLSAYPQHQEEIRQAWSGIAKTTKVTEISPQEKLQNDMINTAAKAGWIKSWMTEEQKVAAADDYSRLLQVGKLRSNYSEEMAVEKSELELEAVRRRNHAQIALPQMGEIVFDKFNNDMKDIMIRVDTYQGVDRAKFVADATAEIDMQLAQLNAQISSAGAHAGSEYINSVAAPIRELAELTKKRLSGELDTAAYRAEVENRTARAALMVYENNPETATYVAMSELMKNTPAAMVRPLEEWATDILKRNSSGTGSNGNLISDGTPRTENGIRQYFGVINSGIDKLNSRSLQDPSGLKAELDVQISNIIKSVGEYEKTAKDAKGFNQLVDFFASNRFKTYMESSKGLSKDSLQTAVEAIQVNYVDNVLPLVQKEWATAVGGGSTGRAQTGKKVVSEFVEPVFAGDSMSFKVKGSVPTKERQKVVADLNKRVAPVINKILRAQSNLSGISQKEVYEQQILPAVFGIQPEGTAGGGQLELPKYGDVIEGYMYVGDEGADPRDPENWEKVGG